MNLADNLARTADARPSSTAVKLDAMEIPFAALAAGASRVGGWLSSLGDAAPDDDRAEEGAAVELAF